MHTARFSRRNSSRWRAWPKQAAAARCAWRRAAGRKNSAARADHDLRAAVLYLLPLGEAFAVGERRVLHSHARAEMRFHPRDHLRGERDLRHKHQRRPPGGKRLLDQLQENKRFAAGCDAMQKCGGGLARIHQRGQLPIRALLGGGKRDGLRRRSLPRLFGRRFFPFPVHAGDHTLFEQAVQHRPCHAKRL